MLLIPGDSALMRFFTGSTIAQDRTIDFSDTATRPEQHEYWLGLLL